MDSSKLSTLCRSNRSIGHSDRDLESRTVMRSRKQSIKFCTRSINGCNYAELFLLSISIYCSISYLFCPWHIHTVSNVYILASVRKGQPARPINHENRACLCCSSHGSSHASRRSVLPNVIPSALKNSPTLSRRHLCYRCRACLHFACSSQCTYPSTFLIRLTTSHEYRGSLPHRLQADCGRRRTRQTQQCPPI